MDKEMIDFMSQNIKAFADGAIAGYLDEENIESNPYDGFLKYLWADGFKYGMEKYFLWCHRDVTPIMETLK